MLELLLHIDSIVQSQEGSSGNPILHRILHHANDCDLKQLRLIEILLTSGKINVNAVNFEARTVLHSVLKECHKSVLCNGNHEDITYKAIKMVLSHGINLNAKDKDGKTPLAIACEIGCAPITRGLLNWCKGKCILMDIDAKDRHGQTALIKAALWKHVAVVKLLLNAGASVNLSDNRGFTALHHTLYEIQTQEAWITFGDFPRNFEDVRRRKDDRHTLLEFSEPHELYKRSRVKLDEDKIAIIKLLLERTELNVNALDCEAYSPLDIAEALIPEIPFVIKQVLIKNEAILNAFIQTEQHSPNNSLYPDYEYEIILHRLCNKTNAYCIEGYRKPVRRTALLEHAEIEFFELDECFQIQMVSVRDQRRRTALHNAVISHQNSRSEREAEDTVQMLIDLGCGINETDMYGRTPLHYADNTAIYDKLIDNGADMSIEDKNGILATRNRPAFLSCIPKNLRLGIQMIIEMMPERTLGIPRLLHDTSKIDYCQHINPNTIPGLVRTHLSHATNHPTYSQVKDDLEIFMKSLASYIKKQDPRFEATTRLVGSSYEGTKIDLPDEFDFNFVLTKISQLCEVLSSPELPTGFCRLKRKEDRNEDHYYDGLFDKQGILIVEKLNRKFQIILKTVLTDSQFIDEHKNSFEWNLDLRAEGLTLFDDKNRLVTTLKLKKTTMDRNSNSCFKDISIDIVACIHIAGWWPDEAISNVSSNIDIKADGCCLVFDYPQRFYPWVPYSESCVRISFAIAESEMIRKSSDIAKQAYMIGKQLLTANSISKSIPSGWKSSYVLKTSLLYCIEAFNSATRQSAKSRLAERELKWDFNEMEFRLWLGCLMKCHLDFIAQDFCPCFFMPTFCLPVVVHLKYSHMRSLCDYSYQFFEDYSTTYKICCSTPFYSLDFHAQMPIIDPIFEHFDRNAMIRGLSESVIENLARQLNDRDSIEYLYCGGRCESILEAFSEIQSNIEE